MDENKPEDEPVDAEVKGEESDEGIPVKLPSGKTIKMISPFEDEGDVPWMVPKDERDLEFYEISWDFLIDDDYRRSKQGKVVILCRQQISDSWFENLGNGVPHPDKVYKSRYDTFNGKHIIEYILGADITTEVAPNPEKAEEIANTSTEKLKVTRESHVNGKPRNLMKEKKVQKKGSKRQKLQALLNKLHQLQILQEDETPKVERWLSTKYEREKKKEEEAKRRRRFKKKEDWRKAIFASLWGDPGSKRSKKHKYDEHFGEGEYLGEDIGGWGEFEEADVGQVVQEPQLASAANDNRTVDRSPDTESFTEQQNNGGGSKIANVEPEEGDEEFYVEVEGEFGEEESSEDITFSDLEREDEFFRTIENRDSQEKKEWIESLKRRQIKMLEKLKKKMALEKSKITPEYIETLNILKVRNNREYLLDWEPFLEFPSTTCIGSESQEKTDKCYQMCYPKSGGKCKCSQPECKAKTGDLCVNQPEEDSASEIKGDFVMGVEVRLPGKGPFIKEEVPKLMNSQELFFSPENLAALKLFPKSKHQVPRVEHFCISGRINMTPFEIRNKYPLWIEEYFTYIDNIAINSRIREAALIRGWINSPYYQFGVDSGLILAPTDENDWLRIEEFKQTPDYAAKKETFGKILEDGVLSQEKMQELLLLGVAEQDPFIRDYLDFAQSKRERQENENAEIDWNLENNPAVYDDEFPPDILNPGLAEDDMEGDEEELTPEDRIRKRKEQYLKNKVEISMNFNQDKKFTRWDDMRFYLETQKRLERTRE